MLALCWNDFDDWSRLFNRVTIIAVSGWGGWLCFSQVFRHKTAGVIPRWMWAIPATMLTSLAVMVSSFVVQCQAGLSTWERNIYGGLLIWSILALLVIVQRGKVEIAAALEKAERYQSEIEEARTILADLTAREDHAR